MQSSEDAVEHFQALRRDRPICLDTDAPMADVRLLQLVMDLLASVAVGVDVQGTGTLLYAAGL